MPNEFTILAENNTQIFSDRVLRGSKVKYELDFSPWAEDNANIASASWEVKSGDAIISSTELSSNTSSSYISYPQSGKSKIEITATSEAGDISVVFLDLFSKDPTEVTVMSDYA